MKMNEKRTAFILAAGLGTRLEELTHNKPKALVELNNKTLLEIAIDNLISHKFNHFVINIHHYGEKIIEFLNDKKYENITIEISDERESLLDTGGAILKALPYFKDSKAVLIHNVDIITDIDFQSVYNNFTDSNDAAWLITQNRNNKRKLVFDKNDNYVGRYNLETNQTDGDFELTKNSKLLSFSGLHIINPDYFYDLELKKCYVFDLYKELSKRNNVKSKFIQAGYWFDLGTKEQLKEASTWLLSQI